MKILVITSKHRADDARIYQKQVKTLSEKYDTSYLHSDKNHLEIGMHVKNGKGFYRRVEQVIKSQNPDVVFVHDPYMIWKLAMNRKRFKNTKIVADIHEDYPIQVLYKPYLKKPIAKFLSFILKIIFPRLLSYYDGVIYATHYIHKKYVGVVKTKQMCLRNYPKIDDFRKIRLSEELRDIDVLYIGSIIFNRGADYIVNLAENSNFKIICAGPYQSQQARALFSTQKDNPNFQYLGLLPYDDIVPLIYRAKIGLVPLHPTKSYLMGTPLKMFEYLAGGAYTLASNFPYWQELYGKIDGLGFIDFENTDEMIQKIKSLLADPKLNSFQPLHIQYNWNSEGNRLIEFVENLKN